MNFFKKIDNYLLHHFPNIWVTKVHIFFPIAILFMLLVYFINVIVIGYDIKDPLPESEWSITLMIVPVLVFIVYWFVIQSRYNVEKSGGKLSIPLEYMNYFLYLLMFAMSYLLITFIPFTNDIKIAKSATKSEIMEDIKNLNVANNFIVDGAALRMQNGRYKVPFTNYVNFYSWRLDYNEENENYLDKSMYNEYGNEKHLDYEDFVKNKIPRNDYNLFILATREQLITMAEKYLSAYNKYANNPIIASPNKVVTNKLIGYDAHNNDVYYEDYENNGYGYEYDWRNRVDFKLEHLASLKINRSGALDANYIDKDIFKLIMSFLLMFALFVWVFKQIHWRNYMFGIIALALTPVAIGLFGFTFGNILNAGEDFLWFSLFTAYLVAIVFVIKGYISNYKSKFSIITAMYLHVWLPILPVFILLCYQTSSYNYYEDYSRRYSEADLIDISFYSSVFTGLLSIFLFKYIYKRMRLLPNDK